MTTVAVPRETPVLPARRRWTRAEYERASELGLFGPEERLELIEGEIIEKMTQNSPHSTAICLVEETVRSAFSQDHCVRVQMPLAVDANSLPEPDVAVVPGSIRDYAKSHPHTAALIVEVSDSTLEFDRTTKAGLYARAGIAEYWIVNLVDGVLEAHRHPAPISGKPLGHAYRSVTHHTAEETLAPLAAPDSPLAVRDLLP